MRLATLVAFISQRLHADLYRCLHVNPSRRGIIQPAFRETGVVIDRYNKELITDVIWKERHVGIQMI